MMEFIIMTGSFTVAILLASVIAFVLMLQPKVVKWYMKYMFKMMENINQITDDVIETKDL